MKKIYLLTVFFWQIPAAFAQDLQPTQDEVVLVQTLIGEAGWRPRPDHAAILHVLERRRVLQGRPTLAQMARAYSTLHRRGPDTPHRRQVHALTAESTPAWALQIVRDFEAGALEDPCAGRALHWGSREDAARFVLLNPVARVVDCGRTGNVFLR